MKSKNNRLNSQVNPIREGTVSFEEFTIFLSKLSGKYEIIGPSEDSPLSAIFLSCNIPKMDKKTPVKSIFFPQRETLFYFKNEQHGMEPKIHEPDTVNTRRVVFGGHPCEIKALTVLDKVFLASESADPYYKQKRENTTLVPIACTNPLPYCFCTAVGGDPFYGSAQDALIIPLDKLTLYIKIFSEKGETLFSDLSLQDKSPETEQRRLRHTITLHWSVYRSVKNL